MSAQPKDPPLARQTKFPRAASVIFWSVIALGVALRVLAAQRGHNYDLDSYRIVSEVVRRGGNVYAETPRYNYGPIWLVFLGLFHGPMFRAFIIALLTATDIGIAFFLRKNFGMRAALLFFLNPISIIITGYHNQFENMAVLLGLVAAQWFDQPARRLRSAAMLGLSLMLKHILFVFPLWLALKPNQKLRERIAALLFPPLIFAAAFLPFWPGGHDGIIRNVFQYRSLANVPLLHAAGLPETAPWPTIVFLCPLIVGAIAFRTRSALESLLIYSLMLVIFTSGIANQYLAIPLAAMAVYPNWLFGLYTLLTTLFLCADSNGFYFTALEPYLPDMMLTKKVGLHAWDPLIVCLLCGFLWMLFAKPLWRLLRARFVLQ